MKHTLLQCCMIVSVFLAMHSQGQTIENLNAIFTDGNATITYDLVGFKAKELYLIDLYASYNDFYSPLKLVRGDVGKNITEGKGKKIEWKASEEAKTAGENITFQIKTTLLFQPMEFINPSGGAIRRGHTTIVEWRGGFIDNEKELELYHYEKKVASLGKMKGVWQYTWEIPKDMEKGDGYSLKLVGGTESLTSSTFRIKPRTPLLLKLSPLFVAAAIIPFLGGKSTTSEALPNAPIPE